MSINEKDLLKRSREGDIEAFESLIREYQKKVFNIAFRMLGNYDDASESAQEVFIKVFKSLKNFKEEAQFSTWIYKITTNVCLDELRKRKNKSVVYIDENIKGEEDGLVRQIEDRSPTPDLAVERNEIRKAVSSAIQDLSDEHRTVIILRDIQGFSYEEIAEIVKCPAGTVKSRINRARISLKDILKKRRELFDEEAVK